MPQRRKGPPVEHKIVITTQSQKVLVQIDHNPQKISVDNNEFILQGSVSDAKASVIANFNGEKIELFVEDDGKFTKTLRLDQGNNAIKVLAYNGNEDEPFAEIESIIEYQPNKSGLPANTIIIIVIVLAVMVAGAFFYFKQQKS